MRVSDSIRVLYTPTYVLKYIGALLLPILTPNTRILFLFHFYCKLSISISNTNTLALFLTRTFLTHTQTHAHLHTFTYTCLYTTNSPFQFLSHLLTYKQHSAILLFVYLTQLANTHTHFFTHALFHRHTHARTRKHSHTHFCCVENDSGFERKSKKCKKKRKKR